MNKTIKNIQEKYQAQRQKWEDRIYSGECSDEEIDDLYNEIIESKETEAAEIEFVKETK